MSTTSGQSTGENALAAAFLADVAEPVRDQLAGSVALGDFLRGAGTLTSSTRQARNASWPRTVDL